MTHTLPKSEIPPGFAVLHGSKDGEDYYVKLKSIILFGEAKAGWTWLIFYGGLEMRVTEAVATVAYLIRTNGALV